jgi:hypothetical protein
MTTTCKNCNHTFEGHFCNNCGQTAFTQEINAKSVLYEMQYTIFSIDKGMFYTTRQLFMKPGQTIRDYIIGKRIKHYKPFAYVFVLSTIYMILTKLTNQTNFMSDFLEGLKNGTEDSEGESSLGLMGDVAQWMANNYAYANLLIIPIFSLASFICFNNSKYNYFQHLVHNSYVTGQRTAFLLIVLPLTYLITNEQSKDVHDLIRFSLSIGLTFWCYYSFFNYTSPAKRVLLTILTYFILALLLIVVVVMLALLQGVLGG